MSHSVTTEIWCDWPECGSFAGAVVDKSTVPVDHKATAHVRMARQDAKADGWEHIGGRDYCRTHKSKAFSLHAMNEANR